MGSISVKIAQPGAETVRPSATTIKYDSDAERKM